MAAAQKRALADFEVLIEVQRFWHINHPCKKVKDAQNTVNDDGEPPKKKHVVVQTSGAGVADIGQVRYSYACLF